LFLTADQRVIVASISFCEAFDIDPNTATGMPLSELANGEWAMPNLASLLRATVAGVVQIESYEIDLKRPGHSPRQLLVHARTLDDSAEDRVRLLVAVTDVTDARAEIRHGADLIRNKANLLQEVQHRVANSLQIIASVLLQSARRAQADKNHGHLRDAQHRSLSIARVQHHLSRTGEGRVNLRDYLTQLCSSLGAFMIADPQRVSIGVTVDDMVVDGEISVSLGMIVTELVINALKHAFPNQMAGRIEINFRTIGQNWELAVRDDGIGMLSGHSVAKTGLGTGIVEALSRNLGADIEWTDAIPGTQVTIRHYSKTANFQTRRN
jgi:two-component sensor histidine kinase